MEAQNIYYVTSECDIIIGRHCGYSSSVTLENVIFEKYVDPINSHVKKYTPDNFYFTIDILISNPYKDEINKSFHYYTLLRYVKSDIFPDGAIFDSDKRVNHLYLKNYDNDILPEIYKTINQKANNIYQE